MPTASHPSPWRLLVGFWAALALVCGAPAWAAPPREVVSLTVDGPINPVVANYVARGIGEADRRHAEAVVIALDTPGGLDSAMRDIVKAMVVSPVPVIVYVSPSGSRAASAGMFITVAAHVAAMAPDTAIGAAHPVGGGGEEIKGPMADKVTNDAVAYVRGLAADRGRNVAWVEDAVRKSVSVTARDAVRLHVVELIAPDTASLLAKLDGRRVAVLGRTVTLHTAGATLVPWPMNPAERLLHTLSNPTLALILLNLGVLGIVFELQNPTGFLAGIAGVIFLLLGLFALGMLPVNWVGVALVFFGLLLLVAELFVPSWGVLGAGGILALVLGSVMMFQGPLPGLAPAWPVVVLVAVVTAGILAWGISMGLKAQKRRAETGREELVGRVGVARSDLAPSGMVFLEGELWSAEVAGEDAVRAGDRVRVDRVEGLRLVVRKASSEG